MAIQNNIIIICVIVFQMSQCFLTLCTYHSYISESELDLYNGYTVQEHGNVCVCITT